MSFRFPHENKFKCNNFVMCSISDTSTDLGASTLHLHAEARSPSIIETEYSRGSSVRSQPQGWMNTLSNVSTMSKRSSAMSGNVLCYKYKKKLV